MAVPIRRLAVPLAALLTLKVLGRRWMADWGATTEELAAQLPGDELIEGTDLTTTRAVTVYARAADIWPWIAQLGQGRGGFYSYDALENLVGPWCCGAGSRWDTARHPSTAPGRSS
jgi:hypothetical protein